VKKKYYELSDKIQRLANLGVRKAIERAHAAGLPVPFSLGNGKILYQWPDGTVTDKREHPEYPAASTQS